jgi:Uma2 family endonuclease
MVLSRAKAITYTEFRQMEFDDNDPYIYELINGELMRKSAPKPRHQQISGKLHVAISNFIKTNNLGEIFYSPIDVFLTEYTVPQPDLVYVSKENADIIDLEEGILGIPDLIIEIISPSSVRLDRITKKELYESFGIKEYWIIDPNNTSIEIYTLVEKTYKLHLLEAVEGKINSLVIAGFEMDLKDIF